MKLKHNFLFDERNFDVKTNFTKVRNSGMFHL